MNCPLNKWFSYEQCVLSDKLSKSFINLKNIVLFTRYLIEATLVVNRHYLFHLLSVLLLKRMCRHRFYVWIACFTFLSLNIFCQRWALLFCMTINKRCILFALKGALKKYVYQMDRVKRIWYLSPMRAAKVQASLRIRAVSPEPSLLAHTSSVSRGTFRQKARSLAPLNSWACAVKMCHDGMLKDTNSLDGAKMRTVIYLNMIKYMVKVTSEFVSSSWQISTAHAQPFRGAKDLAFCLKVPLDSLLVWASSEGSGETARISTKFAWRGPFKMYPIFKTYCNVTYI